MTAGPLFAGRYRLLRPLAKGGMGELYLAIAHAPEFEGFEKWVAIKRILPHFAQNPDFLAMFLNEARLSAKMDHPNVVRVYDMGRAGDNIYFTMEYLHGRHVGQVLRACRDRGKPLPIEAALAVAIGMCSGLHYAHELRDMDGSPLSIIHRDISPSNVFLTYSGEVKIVDFGIAKALAATSITRDGARKGKVNYMSPEQCTGAPLDRRSDIYSIGIVLFELLTMTRLFQADNEFGVMNQIVHGEVPAPSSRRADISPALEAILQRALARDPAARHPTPHALQEELEALPEARGAARSKSILHGLLHDLFGDVPPPSMNDPANRAALEAAPPWAQATSPEDFRWSGVSVDISLGSLAAPTAATRPDGPRPIALEATDDTDDTDRPPTPAPRWRRIAVPAAIGLGALGLGLLGLRLAGDRDAAVPAVTETPPPEATPAAVLPAAADPPPEDPSAAAAEADAVDTTGAAVIADEPPRPARSKKARRKARKDPTCSKQRGKDELLPGC